jgi:long-chain acyl-CoA synthetase
MGWIRSGERQITAEALERRAAQAAAVLERLGVGEGDGVALYLRNDIAFFEASFGAGMLGAYPVPVNWHYMPDEAAYLLRDSGVKVVVVHADLLPPIRVAIPDGVTVVVVDTPPEIAATYGVDVAPLPAGTLRWDELLGASEPRAAAPRPAPSTIIYTSGTTGRPKGVKRAAFTPGQAEVAARMLAMSYGFATHLDAASGRTPGQITTAVLGPLYHSAPNAHAGFAIRSGANLLILPRFDPEEVLRMIEAHRVTHLNMAPIMLVRLAKLSDEVRRRYDLSSLEFVVHAAAPCPPEVKRAMIDWWGPIIHEYYGSTEMGNVTFCTAEEWLAHSGTVGRVMPGAEVRIIDDQGRTLPAGVIGEVVGRVHGLNDFTYQNDDAKRRAMEKQGLLSPGDVGYFDEDGFLYLCDRKSDMIISGGVNIYPAEIEAELHKLPEVADCAVFGIPDDEYGERVHAVVKLKPGRAASESDIRTALRAQLAGFKVPRTIDFADDLPREDSGKIFKRKLREPFWAGRGSRI